MPELQGDTKGKLDALCFFEALAAVVGEQQHVMVVVRDVVKREPEGGGGELPRQDARDIIT